MGVKIFVSYRRKSWGFTQMLAKQLAELIDGEVFIDVSSIDEADFENSILRHLRESSIVLVVVTEHTFNPDRIFQDNDWVRQEIRMALELAKSIVLILVDGLTPPSPELLPPDIRKITRMQGVQFYPEFFSAGVERLVDFIQKITIQEIKINSTRQQQDTEGKVPTTLATLQEAVQLLDKADYDKSIFLLEALHKAEFKSDFFDIEEILAKARLGRNELIHKQKMHDEYSKIAILSQSAFTFDMAHSAWLAFCEVYPDFSGDTHNLYDLLGNRKTEDEANLPKEIVLGQILETKTIDTNYVTTQWSYNAQADNADWLSVPIGILPDGNVRNLHFSANADGTHALIAGTTASGKSELLQTLIMGLAIKYPPDIFQFILVDYAQSLPLHDLPHCQNSITDYSEKNLLALLNMLRDELNRRQQLLMNKNRKDIIDYRRHMSLFDNQPFPHLFIVLDEYAEIFVEIPQFRSELDAISRLGRSLGVSLILSTQRPAGSISEQMRANTKLKIALRVEIQEDSLDLLNRSDAAFLPTIPGRGYIQIGNGIPKLIQIAKTVDVESLINIIRQIFADKRSLPGYREE